MNNFLMVSMIAQMNMNMQFNSKHDYLNTNSSKKGEGFDEILKSSMQQLKEGGANEQIERRIETQCNRNVDL